jgi:aryl-alcohol dehydrogenase-like predicted oxidoreductase
MQTKKLGDSGVEVSVVGLGAWTLGMDWWGKLSDQEAVELVHTALDCGITFFDTGDVYGDGRSEILLGQALQGKRESAVIGTKFGYVVEGTREHAQGERPQNFDPHFCRQALESSLGRLKTDYVDLYQLHNPRLSAIQRDDLFAELERLREEGKIRAYGVALGPAIGWEEEGLYAIEERHVDSVQTVYNVLEQEPGRTFQEAALREGLNTTLLARVPHASDVLSGKVDENTVFSPNDHRSHRRREELARLVRNMRKLEFLREAGRTMGQAAVAFIIAQPAFASVLLTVTNKDDLKEWASAVERPLDEEELARIDQLWQTGFEDEAAANLEGSLEARTAAAGTVSAAPASTSATATGSS